MNTTVQPASSSFNDMAARMYPAMKPGPAPAPWTPTEPAPASTPVVAASPLPHSHPLDLAERVYLGEAAPKTEDLAEVEPAATDGPDAKPSPVTVEVPVEIQELRDADAARRLYGVKTAFATALPDDLYAADEGLAPDVRPVVVNELREIAADVGATNADVMTFRRVANSLTQSPTAEQRAAWHDQIAEQLNAQYGTSAAQALADAAKFARRDPRVARMLAHNGLGDHPEVVLQFARLAREARAAGKLK